MSEENEWVDDPDMQEFLEWADEPGPWDEEDDKIHTVGGLTNDKKNGFMSFVNKTKMNKKEEIEKISNQLLELKEWLSDHPGHPTHLSNLSQWFWEGWGECIDDLKRISKDMDKNE